jgi:hypothetical protein
VGARLYEITVAAGATDALALQEPIARLLCPEPEHAGPCPVPWGFSLDDDGLVVGIYATPGTAVDLVGRVRMLVEPREVTLRAGDPEHFDHVVEQYLIEHGGGART